MVNTMAQTFKAGVNSNSTGKHNGGPPDGDDLDGSDYDGGGGSGGGGGSNGRKNGRDDGDRKRRKKGKQTKVRRAGDKRMIGDEYMGIVDGNGEERYDTLDGVPAPHFKFSKTKFYKISLRFSRIAPC